MLLNRRMSFLSSLRSKYEQYLPCQLKAPFILPHQSTLFQVIKFGDANTPQHALTTRFSCKKRPKSKPLFSHHQVNNCLYQTIVSTERGDRLRQIGQGQRMRRFVAFERMRSLDECQVAVRSRKVDFLSGNERYSVVELMRVARYCVYVSTTACFKFATFCLKSATWHISDFNP